MGIKDIRKDIKNKVFNSKTNDYEFRGLTDKDVQIEQELNLYTNEGQFYVLIADADDEERIINQQQSTTRVTRERKGGFQWHCM